MTQAGTRSRRPRTARKGNAPTPTSTTASEHEGASVGVPAEQKRTIRVLIVDDDESICESCSTVLGDEGYDISVALRGTEAEDLLRRRGADIVLLDQYMSGVPGAKLLETALSSRSDALVIVMTGRPSVESSVEAMRRGAWDYLPKPFSAVQLRILVGRAAHTVLIARESREQEADEVGPGPSPPLGESAAFRAVVALARKVARTDASVFITGESGTGKEMVAQYIHQCSRRRSRKLVALNCAALPEPLLESEMFGHVKGAFTGASRDKPGLMEIASGGTLFLDELTEMTVATQAKLLRVIQDGVVRRVGSTGHEPVVNVRFIAATNRDPTEAVQAGALRKDLYYRLGVVPVHIPPLRERPDDVATLARHFLSSYWKRHARPGLPVPELTPAALRSLEGRPWRGNVRELQNLIEHAVVLADERDEIDVSDLPRGDGMIALSGTDGAGSPPWSKDGGYRAARDRVMARFEKDYLSWVLQETGGNVSEAARIAQVHRATLYRLLEKHGLTKGEVLSD